MTCQVIWPKRTFLHFVTLQIQYHIWGVSNFFWVVYLVYFKVYFTIWSQRIYRRKTKIFRLRWPNYPKLSYYHERILYHSRRVRALGSSVARCYLILLSYSFQGKSLTFLPVSLSIRFFSLYFDYKQNTCFFHFIRRLTVEI